MAKVRIYRFKVYDIQHDEAVISKRWGTEKAIKEIACGQVLQETGVEVDDSLIHSDIEGFTERGFDPHRRHGDFQTKVR